MLKTPVPFEVNEVKAVGIAKILLNLIGQRHWLFLCPNTSCPETFKLALASMHFT